MGGASTKGAEDVVLSDEELARQNNLSVEEVGLLLQTFTDGKERSVVKLDEFQAILQQVYNRTNNPSFKPEHAQLIFSIMDIDKSGQVSTAEFVHGVTVNINNH